MKATKTLKEILVTRKLQHWLGRATNPSSTPKEVTDAKRNYWRVLRNNPKIAKKHGYGEGSVFEGEK